MRFTNDSDSCCKCFLVDLGYDFVFTDRDYPDWEKELFGVRIWREQSIDQRRRNLAAVSLETRMFVNFGARSEWLKIKWFLSVSDFRFMIRQNKNIF